MTTTAEQKDHIINQLAPIGDFTVRPMMGEYLLYLDGVYIGGIYDNRLLLKIVPATKQYHLPEQLPYASAKRMMYQLTDFDNLNLAREILLATKSALQE